MINYVLEKNTRYIVSLYIYIYINKTIRYWILLQIWMNLHNYIITPAVCIRFEQMVDKHVENARSSEFKTEYR